MQRFLAIILLLCFGALVPVQGMSWRWCLLENKVISTGFGVSGGEKETAERCCPKCDPHLPSEHRDDCCVDIKCSVEATIPVSPERLPPVEVLLVMLPLMGWQEWLHPVVQEKLMVRPHPPKPIPIERKQRQAVLGVWTV